MQYELLIFSVEPPPVHTVSGKTLDAENDEKAMRFAETILKEKKASYGSLFNRTTKKLVKSW